MYHWKKNRVAGRSDKLNPSRSDRCQSKTSNAPSQGSCITLEAEIADTSEDETLHRQLPDMIEPDGVTNAAARDPPGPSTIHIPFGDHRSESYRVATFTKFPKVYPVNNLELACSGFYWTGYKDMVRCFSCGMTVENWMAGDDESDSRWHKRDCAMAQGLNCGNIASNYSERKSVFQKIYSICRGVPLDPVIPMPCSSQFHSRLRFVHNPIVQGTDTFDGVGGATGGGRRFSPEWKPSMLGDIISEEQRRLIKSLDLRKELDRRQTFRLWPSYPAPELAMRLAEEGFFYLGNLDRTQCFSCCGVLKNWSKHDTPRTEHRKHFPDCDIVQGLETRNIPMAPAIRRRLDEEERHRIASLRSISPREPDDPPPEEKRRLASLYPCKNPANPHMESEEARFNSFRQSWPENRLKCTPRQIAKAGFFFLGQGDKTKCYYCNGGLQNWEENDEPWTEHAKWFPQCEFIQRTKGPRFVRKQVQEHPNLNRPQIRNPVPYDISDLRLEEELRQTFTCPPAVAAAGPPPRFGVDELSDEEVRRRNLCRSCRTLPADRLCQPCRHASLCSSCANRVRNCPFCKSRVDSTVKVRRQ